MGDDPLYCGSEIAPGYKTRVELLQVEILPAPFSSL
jgi:hypothetical protein